METEKTESEQTASDGSAGVADAELPRQDAATVAADKRPSTTANHQAKKERLMLELKEIGLTVGYLAASLSILETYKSLILLQQGINDFQHNYIFALVEAVALGKIVAITQNLPFLKACNRHSLATAVLYQAVVMTLITDVAGRLEDVLFPRSAKLLSQSGDPLALAITHQFAAMLIFILLFTVKGIDKALGAGKLWKLFFGPAASKSDSHSLNS
jgi:hypothetical protein